MPRKDWFPRRPGFAAAAFGLTAMVMLVLIFGVLFPAAPSVGNGPAPGEWTIVGGMLAVLIGGLCFLAMDRARCARRVDLLERRLAEQRTVLEAAPGAWRAWTAEGPPSCGNGLQALLRSESADGLGDIAAALDPAAQASFREAVDRLQNEGQEFRLVARLADGCHSVELSGLRRAGGSDQAPIFVLWARDVTAYEAEAANAAAVLARTAKAATAAEGARDILQAMLDRLPVPVWLRDDDRQLVWVNAAYAESVDAAKDRAVAEQIELAGPLLPAGSATETGPTAGIPDSAGLPACSETRHIVIAGERRLVQLIEATCPVSSGPAAGQGRTLGYALDLTSVEEAERERDRHIAAHADVLENLKSAIAIFGPDKRLGFFNTAYVQLWGFDEAWLKTHPTLGEVLEDLRERRRLPEFADFGDFRQSQLGLFTSLIAPDEDWMHLPDGTTLRVLITPHPFGGLMFVLEDVTSALALERSYNTLMAVQRESLDNLAEGIAVYGDDGRLRLSNPAFHTIWALHPEDLQSNPHISEVLDRTRGFFEDVVDWEASRAAMIAWALEREPRTGRMDRADGSILQYSTVPLPDGAVLHSYLDVTDSAKVEQALRASNQALETADRLKSEFIANVSYQLRTPLNAIMGFAEILDNQYFGALNERQSEYTCSIVDASRRLLALINDILDIATIEAGYMALELKQVRVEDLLRGVYDLTREWAAKQSLQIVVDCPPKVGSIEADDRRLKQALYNLVSNSVKFTPPGGRIVLSAWRCENEIGMVVSDTGIGIPQEDQDRVFGRFERGHSHLRQSGVGLGLALVKSFIEMHGGRITLKSAPGLGTTVTCIVPAHPLAAYTGAVREGSGFPSTLPFPTLVSPPD